MDTYFHYHFHPVGQGLFASGCLHQPNIPQPRFLWVYDCGSLTYKKALFMNCKVGDLKRFTNDKADIELLTLSHFDEDHISGVTALLSRFNIDTLLLPYAPLWDRLEIAFANEVDFNSEAMRFTIDPVTFLQGRGNIRRIILVPPSEGGAETPPSEVGRGDLPDGPWTIDGRTKKVTADEEFGMDFGLTADAEMLPAGETLTINSLWEFKPYNRPRRNIRPQFVAEVQRRREALLRGPAEERESALIALKRLYEEQIANCDRTRNDISLFLYAGPIYETWDTCKLFYHQPHNLPPYPRRLPLNLSLNSKAPLVTSRCSVLYSGDGYLHTSGAFEKLKTHLGESRLRSLGIFQVNHHGARGTWHQGLAKKLNPYASVFSSDPGRGPTYHPHAEVLRDFWPHRPVQVNRTGHSSGGLLSIRSSPSSAH